MGSGLRPVLPRLEGLKRRVLRRRNRSGAQAEDGGVQRRKSEPDESRSWGRYSGAAVAPVVGVGGNDQKELIQSPQGFRG